MKEECKISVILPVYNGEKYIKEAIDSVLSQTEKDFELIIVNDCSTDNTTHIIEEYAAKDKRIKIITNQTNQKLPKSLNIGFSIAKGEYFSWTSDDNIFHSNALSVMSSVLDDEKDIGAVYADYNTIDTDGRITGQHRQSELDCICFGNIVGACFLYRRELAEKAGEYDPSFFLAEDYEFFIRCHKYGRFYHISEILYDYRVHEKSLTGTRKKEIAQVTKRVFDHHYDFLFSLCKNQDERNRFYWTLISLNCWDRKERNKMRAILYKKDKEFAKADKRYRFRRVLERVILHK